MHERHCQEGRARVEACRREQDHLLDGDFRLFPLGGEDEVDEHRGGTQRVRDDMYLFASLFVSFVWGGC